jgi:hypothetical protein
MALLCRDVTLGWIRSKTVETETGCWEWQGRCGRDGYGRFRAGSQCHVGAHRAAWALANNAYLPKSVMVLHRCDNPPCCNPAHLFVGDAKLNAEDKIAKGRNRVGVGVRQHLAKLDPNRIVEIRRLGDLGVGPALIADRYGVCVGTVRAIVARATWRHVPEVEPILNFFT